MQWLVHHAHRLLSLTLSNTAAKIGTAELWDERIHLARTQGMGALVDGVIARWFSPGFAEHHPEQFARAKATLLAKKKRMQKNNGTDRSCYAGVSAALRDSDLRDAVGSITVPTLVIGGVSDQAAPIQQARWLHEQITGSRHRREAVAHLCNRPRKKSRVHNSADQFLVETTP